MAHTHESTHDHELPVPPENQAGHHPDHDQDKPDLDEFAEALGVTDGSSDAADEGGVPAQLRSAATTARELAEPVAQVVQETLGRAARSLNEYWHLSERVERLESEVAELRRQLESQQR